MKIAVGVLVKIAFCIYCLAVICIMFVGRHRMAFERRSLWKMVKYGCDFVPFSTIYDYIDAFINNRINTNIIVSNLAGNLLLLFPAVAFIPCIFTQLRKFDNTFLTLFAAILMLETVQLITSIGVFDADDLIHSLAGASVAYGITEIPPLRQLFLTTGIMRQSKV